VFLFEINIVSVCSSFLFIFCCESLSLVAVSWFICAEFIDVILDSSNFSVNPLFVDLMAPSLVIFFSVTFSLLLFVDSVSSLTGSSLYGDSLYGDVKSISNFGSSFTFSNGFGCK